MHLVSFVARNLRI